MSIELQKEQVLSLADASQAIPSIDGKRPVPSTLWRWCKVGVRGTQLEYLRFGNRIVTSVEALSRFSQRLAAADQLDKPFLSTQKSSTNKQRQRSEKQAEQILKSKGVV